MLVKVTDLRSKGWRHAEEDVLSSVVGQAHCNPGGSVGKKLRPRRSSGRTWRRTISWPQRNFGKPSGASGRRSTVPPALFTVDRGCCWNENLEDLLNPTNRSSAEEAEGGDLAVDSPINQANQVTKVVRKRISGNALGVDEICP